MSVASFLMKNQQIYLQMKIKVFEAFAGYGSQSIALQQLKEEVPGFDYEVIGFSEIDRFAVLAY